MKKLVVLSLAIACCVLIAQTQEPLTPRDSFWSASDLVEVAPNPATQTASQAKRAAETKAQKTTAGLRPSYSTKAEGGTGRGQGLWCGAAYCQTESLATATWTSLCAAQGWREW